jgi:hypothetical protein
MSFAFFGFASRPLAIVAIAVLAGCATPKQTVPRYVAPSTGATARLVVRANLPADDRYGVFVLDQTETCGSPRLVGAGDASHHPDSTQLATNHPQTVEFRFLRADKRMCIVRWTFSPVAGRSYLFSGVGTPGACRAGLLDMSDPDHLRPETTALRRNAPGQACVPLAQAKGYTGGAADGHDASQDAVLREGAGADDLQGLIGR